MTELFLAELEREAPRTRRALEQVPEGKPEWAPHPKSMQLGYLAALVATLPSWIVFTVNQDELDIRPPGGKPYTMPEWRTMGDLLDLFDRSVEQAREALQNTNDEHLLKPWRFLVGGRVMSEDPRHIVLRDTVLNHLAHHRGQLTDAIGSAAILGLAVSWLCSKMPLELRAGFYAIHLGAAAVYAAIWAGVMRAFEGHVPRTMLAGWFLEGVWIYAIVAGASYAFQTQRRALQAEKSLAVARLDALRSRLHPHFLFNALHTVGALVRHDPAEAESAVEKLGDMLRYTLRDGESDAVPFAEEWEFTRRYLEFEQLRYGERLRVKADIDPRALDCSAPSFALQTLVENAVHHSIDRRPEGGNIEIHAQASDDGLHIRVRDDGVRGDRGQGTGDRGGYGLNALRERLQTVYGASLIIVRDGQGFEASFTIDG